ncbi:MAG: acetaldehyde dehydrogenase (acetylating) [Actinobacteria bacterium]|nr:acetaldehyde dehydrogenase (acetylating) [Actinomycetota bacterium]
MTACAILGSGNIGTDLMYKVLRSGELDLRALIGIDPDSEGLDRARKLGVAVSSQGLQWLIDNADQVDLLFDATSAGVHRSHAPTYERLGIVAIDLTPAKIGPPVVPGVNLRDHVHAPNVNLITCGGQATTPVVAAVSRVARVPYAEIVSTVASDSAGPGTRANIDEFTRTTSACLEEVGGAGIGKAIMILNPSDPPIMMRNTVYCGLKAGFDSVQITESIMKTVEEVRAYVPGYRLKGRPLFEEGPFATPGGIVDTRVVVLLEVSGAADFLPEYAGNLDIMTAAAVRVGEAIGAAREGRKS